MILNDTYHVGCIPISAVISEHDPHSCWVFYIMFLLRRLCTALFKTWGYMIKKQLPRNDLLFGSVFEIGDKIEKSYCFFWLQGSRILLLPSGCLMYFTPWFKLEIIESEPPAS